MSFQFFSEIPVYMTWVQYVSPFQYASEILQTVQWQDVQNIPCTKNGTICVENGMQVIEKNGLSADRIGLDIGLLFSLMVGARLVSFAALLIKRAIYRKNKS